MSKLKSSGGISSGFKHSDKKAAPAPAAAKVEPKAPAAPEHKPEPVKPHVEPPKAS